MTVSVIVPVSWNKVGRRLDNCLASVRRQSGVGQVEIVLVWLRRKGIPEQLRVVSKKARRYQARLIRRRFAGPWPPSLARNLGFRAAKGGILACLDVDAVLHPLALKEAVDAIREERLTAVRAPTRMKTLSPKSRVFRPGTPARAIRRAMRSGKIAPGPGSLIVAPREAVFGIRGWDESFLGYGPADWDYWDRLVAWGCRPVVAKLHALHQWHRPRFETRNEKLKQRNRAIYRRALPERNPGGWGGKKL